MSTGLRFRLDLLQPGMAYVLRVWLSRKCCNSLCRAFSWLLHEFPARRLLNQAANDTRSHLKRVTQTSLNAQSSLSKVVPPVDT